MIREARHAPSNSVRHRLACGAGPAAAEFAEAPRRMIGEGLVLLPAGCGTLRARRRGCA